jgi:hypothetical protein
MWVYIRFNAGHHLWGCTFRLCFPPLRERRAPFIGARRELLYDGPNFNA